MCARRVTLHNRSANVGGGETKVHVFSANTTHMWRRRQQNNKAQRDAYVAHTHWHESNFTNIES